MVLHNIKETIEQFINTLGLHPYIGLGTSAFIILGELLFTVTSGNIPTYTHPLQIMAWTVSGLVGLLTILALLKTHTTLFDNIKWIKKK